MTSKNKKIISGICSLIIMMGSVPTYANAETISKNDILNETDISMANQTSIPRMLWTLQNRPEYLDIKIDDNSNIEIGDYFTIVNIENGNTNENNSIGYYPISENGEIKAIITIIKNDNEITTTIGQDFAPQLSKALATSDTVTLLSIDNSGIVTIDENNNATILSTDGTINNDDIITSAQKNLKYDINVNDKFTINKQEVYDKTIPIEKVEGLYSEENEKLRKNYYTHNTNLNKNIIKKGQLNFDDSNKNIEKNSDNPLFSYNPNATALGDYLDNYETVYQGNLNICWAATVASMLRWEMPNVYSGYSAINVCDALNHSYDGEYIGNVSEYLSKFLNPYNDNYIPTFENKAYGQSDIKTIINNEDPAYMSSYANDGSGRHATALCGYLFFNDGTFAIRLMNPGMGVFQLSDRQYSSDTFRYPYNNTYFTWDKSIRFYYHHG